MSVAEVISQALPGCCAAVNAMNQNDRERWCRWAGPCVLIDEEEPHKDNYRKQSRECNHGRLREAVNSSESRRRCMVSKSYRVVVNVMIGWSGLQTLASLVSLYGTTSFT